MTFHYDECADSLWVSLSEPTAACVYVESQTAGVILRVEESTEIIRGFEVLAWSRRVANGPILIPEVVGPEYPSRWSRDLSVR